MTFPELFANPPIPGQTIPWVLTTLEADVNTAPAPGTVETWTFTNPPPSDLAQPGQYRFIIGSEICIDQTGGGGTAREIVRGAESATETHSAGDNIYFIVTAGALRQLFLPGLDVQIFNSSSFGNATQTAGQWVRPTGNFSIVRVMGIGGGGGGGSGGIAGAGVVATGGGGGGGGGRGEIILPLSLFAANETVKVGDGGLAGAAVSAAGAGHAANAGGHTSMTVNGTLVLVGRSATGGGAGAGSGVAGAAGVGGIGEGSSGGGGASGAQGGAGNAGGGAVAGGGGSGGGVSAANASSAGGGGGVSFTNPNAGSVGAAGTGAGGGNGGSPALQFGNSEPFPNGGGGGGGSEKDGIHNGGNGGAGGNWGGGGGGGGACRTGGSSGAGGNGAPGILIVVTS